MVPSTDTPHGDQVARVAAKMADERPMTTTIAF